ncbi:MULTISPECIES: SMC-Scp complex subunit ScpB [unclassified Thioalkalivibrio]|uniref:SMC-Scp complex subunit ScpB n=1 Tax=unclassified Thioalkalivibrio TaxID=2621013 RepID=UPI000375C1EE|nr:MULTISPECIES: SMC-Scp complex subunit ScpB [unclassified Thioalkalivibrio]
MDSTIHAPVAAADDDQLRAVELAVEAVLFAAAEPVAPRDLKAACEDLGEIDQALLEQALGRLEERYRDRAIELVRSAGGYRFRVRSRFSATVQAAQPERPARLSRALLETLAIIAYRQPVTRAEIEAVRGVAVSSGIMRTLQEREWVRVVGHKEVPGRPALYATTRGFLDDLGLKRLEELPPLDQIRDLADVASDAGLSLAPPEAEEDTGPGTNQRLDFDVADAEPEPDSRSGSAHS